MSSEVKPVSNDKGKGITIKGKITQNSNGYSMSNTEKCLFCRIVNKQSAALIIYETGRCTCFLPLKMEVYGHTLIVPNTHIVDIYDISESVLCEVVKAVKHLVVYYKKAIGATGCNLLHASGIEAQQSMFHFHFHLFPRFLNENPPIDAWPELPSKKYDREDFFEKVKSSD